MVSGSDGFLGRYVSSVCFAIGQPLAEYEPGAFNAMVGSLPPPEFNMIAYGVDGNTVPIVGRDIPLREALRRFVYEPVDSGSFVAFTPVLVSLDSLALLHQEPDWTTARAYLAKFDLFPIMVFRSDVRWVRGEQVVLADFRLFARTD